MDRWKPIFLQTIWETLIMKEGLKLEIIVGLSAIVGFFILTGFGEQLILWSHTEFANMVLDLGDQFTQFAVIINALYEIIPQTFQVVGIGAIYVKALESGASPLLFIIGGTIGKLVGQILLYYAGHYGIRAFGKKSSFAGANHFMHKYHFLVFLLPPFTGSLGDIIMIYAGVKKIPLSRIMPILIIANILDQVRWIVLTMGQLELVDSLN